MLNLPKLRRALLLLAAIGLAAGFFLGPLAWDIPAALIAVVVAIDLINALRRGTLGVDIIALLAIVGALLLRSPLTPAAIFALWAAGGPAREESAAPRARRDLAPLIGRSPRIAHRHDGAII